MLVLIFSDIFHPKRSFASMNDLMVGEAGDPFIVLESPPFEMVSSCVLEIAIGDAGGIIRLENCSSVMRHEKRIFSEHAFGIIAVLHASHHDGDQIQMVLARGILQFTHLFAWNIWRKNYAVVTRRGCAGKLRDHSIDLVGIA